MILPSISSISKSIASSFGLADNPLFNRGDNFAIFDNEGSNQLFQNVSIVNVEVNQDRDIASHPLETNTYIQDNIVLQPRTITITISISSKVYDIIYNDLQALFNDTVNLYSIMQDKQLYNNMTLKSMPTKRDPSQFDLIEIPLVFQEFLFGEVKKSDMSDPNNVELKEYSDREQRGLQTPIMVSGQDKINKLSTMTIPGQ